MSLHTPSNLEKSNQQPVASGSVASPPSIQSELIRLTSVKDAITTQMSELGLILKANKVTMQTPLIDPEGFPRSDIDVASVRTARTQIIRLRNDLKDVMVEMQALVERGIPRREDNSDSSADNQASVLGSNTASEDLDKQPFAKVDAVAPNSPASLAGLQREDLLISMGPINHVNHDNLKAVASLVAASEGVALPITIRRSSTTVGSAREETAKVAENVLRITLIPRSGWGGRGMLGCHVVPL